MSNPEKGSNFLILAFEYSLASNNLITNITKNNGSRCTLRPAIFMQRHSIELLLKGLHSFRKNKTWGHNLIDININATSILKENTPPKLFAELAKEMENYSEQKLYDLVVNFWTKKISDLSEKYSKHLYLDGFSTLDKNNEFLRYPDNLRFEELIKDENWDLNEIREDSEELFKIISFILFSYSNMLIDQ